MKALLRYSHKSHKIKVANISFPKLGKSKKHAILNVKYAGICGRDLEHYETNLSLSKVPYVLGHEFSGTISKLPNSKNNKFKLGERVVSETVDQVCEKCFFCKSGFYNLCKKRKNIGGTMNGAFASNIKVPLKYIHKLPKEISFEEGALIEPMCVCYNAVLKNSEIKKNDLVVIIGAGTMGLICLKFAIFKKAKVIMIGHPTDKLQLKLAKKNGAYKIFTSNQDYVSLIEKITKGMGSKLVIDTVGGVNETINNAIKIVSPRGQITKIGWFMKKSGFNFDALIRKNIRLQGSFSHNYEIWEKCIILLKKKYIRLNDLVSKKMKIEDWYKSFNLLKKRKAIKILLYSNEKNEK